MKHLFVILLAALLGISLQAQDSTYRVKMMHYNLLMFGDCDGAPVSDKYTWLGSVLNAYKPDIFTVNELFPAVPFANGIVQLSFTYSGSIKYANFTNFSGGSLANQVFYNSQLFGLKSNTVMNSSNIRDINIYEMYFKPSINAGDTTFLYVITAHLKAGSGSSDEDDRWDASKEIMNWVQANGQGKNVILTGDLNISSANENAFQELVSTRAADVSLIDPLNLTSGWGGSSFAYAMTQSPRTSGSDCGVNGGLDDRFDFILPNKPVMDGSAGIAYVDGSYAAYGNDGDDFNTELDCSSNSKVNTNTCLSLKLLSDHLPVVVELDMEGFAPATSTEALLLAEVKAGLSHEGLKLAIDGPGTQRYKVSLTNMLGQQLLIATQGGKEETTYPLPSLKKGIYVLQLSDARGRTFSRKMILR